MKKTLIALTILGGAFATNASAASYGGVHAGTGLGVHYQTDIDADSAYRVGVGFEGAGIGAGVDYLNRVDRNPVGNGFVPYYGAGVGVGFADGVSFSPRAFVGTDFVVNQNARVFGEVGPKVTLNSAGNTGVALHGRVGINFRLN
ncbi:hypothetical protein Deipr_0216 [Deinococcus proteolyticus MRP]|uniref:Outer membrane protein beta-barrel domain-containing protein n=1 Tax=Deinococcus proteolyticus (strain ATCC 35074 / DSM 20540 / JCM 6276 / NBRC 101906 / NCIMB 13154 / VKM Ac-1939 / CCM 2703 / MRP) TaxID=693977 RepID=F0RP74_DEIPM|nr:MULTISPECIES: hypothetical protein [Deinococcus]ADY25389.1 hypothetical protein Deipr_0216 [Deinococcus proteolyticus MRP]MCY1701514.1 hypothetical protein [Deinococcus sp. SL84]